MNENLKSVDNDSKMVWEFIGFESIADMMVLIQFLQEKGFNYFYSPIEIALWFTKTEEQ